MSVTSATIGKNMKLTIADKPEILLNMKTNAQIINIDKPINKSIARIKPNDEATPFPPLNLLKTGNI